MNKLKKNTLIAIVSGIAAAAALLLVLTMKPERTAPPPAIATTSAVPQQAQQTVIEITAKDGYSPSASVAPANTPMILRIKTNNTLDCSSVLVIPALHYRQRLPTTGGTDVPVPPQPAGTEITGACGMGIYHFSIKFEG